MFDRTDLEAAASEQWDVVIAGSSFAAMFFLKALPRGTRVLIVEKGDLIGHADQLRMPSPPAEDYAMTNRSEHRKIWVAHTLFGGNSNCWWGQTPRFHPNDFRLASHYGRGVDWPFGYDTLEPLYAEVEAVMGIAGGGVEHILPRSTPFPHPPHTPSRSDSVFFAARPDIWVPVATARSNGGGRARCCGNGVCERCPIDAKFTVLNGISDFERIEARLLLNCAAFEVPVAAGRATGLVLRSRDGVERAVHADVTALATNGINNAAILLRSGLRAPALGRYLHEQLSRNLEVDVDIPNYFGGSSITGHCYGFYDGPHRGDHAGVLIENYNAPNAIRIERGRWTHRLKLKLIAESLPHAENRVVLTEDGWPHILWNGHSVYEKDGLEAAVDRLAEIVPATIEAVHDRGLSSTEAHIQGTHRMGKDVESSVVDYRLQTHEVRDLFALGSGAFPTCSPANPTLTICALSLLAARSL